MAIAWSKSVSWGEAVRTARQYFETHPDLKYGPRRAGPAYAVLDHLCSEGTVYREELKAIFELNDHGVLTILSNVTMALQRSDEVASPEEGGWYVSFPDPRRYVASPGFAAAWLGLKP